MDGERVDRPQPDAPATGLDPAAEKGPAVEKDPAAPAAALAAWLAERPRGEVLHWGQDHKLVVEDCHSGWVDVHIPAADEALAMNWLWTVDAPDRADPDRRPHGPDPVAAGAAAARAGDWRIVMPYDLDLWAVWDPESFWFLPDAAVAVPAGARPSPAERAALDALAAAAPGRRVESSQGFSTAALNAALAAWTAAAAGRSDLVFVFDPELVSARLAALLEREVDPRSEGSFEIGDGIRASGEVLDFLLAEGPDRAAEITAQVKETLSPLIADLRATRGSDVDGNGAAEGNGPGGGPGGTGGPAGR